MIAEGGMGGVPKTYMAFTLCCSGTVSSLFMLVHHSVGGWKCKCAALCCEGQDIVQLVYVQPQGSSNSLFCFVNLCTPLVVCVTVLSCVVCQKWTCTPSAGV